MIYIIAMQFSPNTQYVHTSTCTYSTIFEKILYYVYKYIVTSLIVQK